MYNDGEMDASTESCALNALHLAPLQGNEHAAREEEELAINKPGDPNN